MVTININDTFKSIIDEHPSFKKVMCDVGFKIMLKPNMLNSIGRFTPIKHAIKLKSIPVETLQEVANKYGFLIVEPSSD